MREMVIKCEKVLCCMVLFAFLTLTLTSHRIQYSCLLQTEELTNRNVWLRNSCVVYERKKGIVHSRGTSDINLAVFVYSFDVCRAP